MAAAIPLALLLLLVGSARPASDLNAQGNFTPRTYRCFGNCLALRNDSLQADVGPSGAWVLGTRAGDPNTAMDDDAVLLYGFAPGGLSNVGTGYATIRLVQADADPIDLVWDQPAEQEQSPEKISTTWRWDSPIAFEATQHLSFRENPFSGRPDLVDVSVELSNLSGGPLEAGLRLLLDIKLGANDGAPYFLPGVGAVSQERSFSGDEVPAYWIAFESETYDPTGLRSVGLLEAPDIEAPNRFVIGRWRRLAINTWDVALDPAQSVTSDSAVALYWEPRSLADGASLTYRSAYGVAGDRGGDAFLSAPVQADCNERFEAAIFVSNFSGQALTGGRATLSLPPELRLTDGASTRPMTDIAPGDTGSVAWGLRVQPGSTGLVKLSASASFDGGQRFDQEAEIALSCAPPPTATPLPPPTQTPDPTSPNACEIVLSRVPAAAVAAALANPASVYGWMEPANPALPPGANNPPKMRLSIRDFSKRYHPLFNPLVYKVGCP